MAIDLDDTTRCPLDDHCAICGTTASVDITATFDTSLGVLCATLCEHCVETQQPMPSMALVNAARRVAAHCEHLGITLEEMAQARESDLV